MGIIFDLDQTLIESHTAEQYRTARKWDVVYEMVPKLTPFEGIHELLTELNLNSVPYGIVTSSPASYCNRIIKHWNWNTQFTVCFHDTTKRKPHPDPINLAVRKLGLPKQSIVSIGDDPNDVIASRNAGVISAGVLWGAKDRSALIASNPDYLFETIEEMSNFLRNQFIS
ncbi:HAD family hydrolase [Paenibacillus tengchongensis]|uniref:HAD family hydrolase n=1 Tax=Paenibacillus tengchongensis TaxID=2608684 RepID=UPI001652AF5C|nr:HAD family hydrolase [Paenibacillus tengchongensis]